jgi:arabinofuranosyltransferase
VHSGSEKAESHGGGISRGLSYVAGLALLALMLPVALNGKSATLDGVRYWWLADDAMISMRYGRNLAEGLGLVWNASERVEGYTNLLWTLFMALVHLTPLPDSKTSLAVLLANVGIAAATVPLIARLIRLLGGGAWATAAALAAYVLGADTSFLRPAG